MFEKQNPEQAAIFRCENGFGLEVINSKTSSDQDDPESFVVKRYVAMTLEDAISMLRRYFIEGEI